jgi:hypothetical protein
MQNVKIIGLTDVRVIQKTSPNKVVPTPEPAPAVTPVSAPVLTEVVVNLPVVCKCESPARFCSNCGLPNHEKLSMLTSKNRPRSEH